MGLDLTGDRGTGSRDVEIGHCLGRLGWRTFRGLNKGRDGVDDKVGKHQGSRKE